MPNQAARSGSRRRCPPRWRWPRSQPRRSPGRELGSSGRCLPTTPQLQLLHSLLHSKGASSQLQGTLWLIQTPNVMTTHAKSQALGFRPSDLYHPQCLSTKGLTHSLCLMLFWGSLDAAGRCDAEKKPNNCQARFEVSDARAME